MARGATLLEMTGELRTELGRAANVAVGPGDLPMLQRTLRRVQKTLWANYDWPFLRKVFDPIPLQAGSKLYDPPPNLDIDRIESVAVWQNDIPVPLRRGIGWDEYSAFRPDERSDPVMAWDIRTNDDIQIVPQIEVWPTPASDNYSMQVIGIRKLRRFTHDADLCDLDDEMVILFAAAQLLARQKAQDAPVILNMATEHLAKVRARASTGEGKLVRVGLGQSTSNFDRRSRIVVAGYKGP